MTGTPLTDDEITAYLYAKLGARSKQRTAEHAQVYLETP
jgi:hypothetical protein